MGIFILLCYEFCKVKFPESQAARAAGFDLSEQGLLHSLLYGAVFPRPLFQGSSGRADKT